MFFGCRASGEKNGVKSNIISAFALIISQCFFHYQKKMRDLHIFFAAKGRLRIKTPVGNIPTGQT